MTAFTERDRAKRAKLKARYESIKQKPASGDVGKYSPMPTSPTPSPLEVDDNRDDEPLSSAMISASDSESRDTSPPTESNDTMLDGPDKSKAHSAAQQRATQVALAKKKLAASRKAVSPMKTAYNYKPIVETQKTAVPTIEEKANVVPYTPPRVVSKKVEMARKLAASRAATSSPQPKMEKPEPDVRNSIKVKRNAFAHKSQTLLDVGSVKSKSSSFERTEIMDRFAMNKTAATRSNELARLRAASPALAAAVKPISQPKLEHDPPVEHYESDEESTFCGDDLAKDAVFQRREQFRKKQAENSNKHSSNIALDPPPPSTREQFLKRQEDKLRTKAVEIPPPPPPPPPPHRIENENASQAFGDGFGFSQEEFSNASWGLGPAFSADMKTNGDADWSNPVNCSADQKGSKSAEWAASFDSKTSKDEGENAAEENIPQGDKESPSATASVQYMDFGVGKSLGGSVECDSIIDEEEELGNSFVSEETTASATEFDPLSMFGGSDDLSDKIEQTDINAHSKESCAIPTSSKEEEISNDLSSDHVRSVSSSKKMTRTEDESNSISFHSLNSGGLMKPPKFAHQPPANNSTKTPPHPTKNVLKAPPDSPSGTESLESWWQSRYASSQNNDINAAVQEALLNEASSVSKKSQADSSKNMSGVSTISTNLTPVRSNERVPSREINEEESCSVFSGISGVDDGKKTHSRYQGAVKKKFVGQTARSISLAESEEDIFSGVSASNTTDLQADDIAMKSDMGGNSSGFTLKRANAESQSMLYGNNTVGTSQYADKKVMNSLADGMSTVSFSTPMQTANAASQYMREPKESLNSLSENNYGVIELKKNEKSSPANSQTSDITSSVIFGFDPPRRAAHQRRGRVQERIIETNESEEADSMVSKEVSVNDKVGQVKEGDVNKMAIASRGVSLVAPSTCDSTSQGSSFDGLQSQSEGESQEATSFVSGLRDQAKAAILSRFSCGLLNASSFAVCAPNGKKISFLISSFLRIFLCSFILLLCMSFYLNQVVK